MEERFNLLPYNPDFNVPEIEAFEIIVGKGENAGNQHFPTMFSILPNKKFLFGFMFIISPANASI